MGIEIGKNYIDDGRTLLSAVLPEDAFIRYDLVSRAYYCGIHLAVQSGIAEELVKEDIPLGDVIPSIVERWFHEMHEKLTQSEVQWRIKREKQRS